MENDDRETTKGGEESASYPTSTPATAGSQGETGSEAGGTEIAGSRGGDTSQEATPLAQEGPSCAPNATGKAASWFSRHKLLSGIAIGALAVLLLGGMFAIGYAVGKPGDGRPGGQVPGPERLGKGMQGAPPETPLRKFRERRLDRLETLIACRDEIAEFLAGELGMTVDGFRVAMANGKTVAELAEEKGLSTEDLIASLAAKIKEIADRLAAEGEATSAQAERIKDMASELASILVRDGPRLFTPHVMR